MSVSREIEGQSIQSASSDNAVQVLLLAFNLRAGQPCSAVLIVRKDQNRQVSSTEPQVSNEFQLLQVYQTSTDRKDWNATRPHRLTRVITAAIGTQMGYLLGNPFGHRVRQSLRWYSISERAFSVLRDIFKKQGSSPQTLEERFAPPTC